MPLPHNIHDHTTFFSGTDAVGTVWTISRWPRRTWRAVNAAGTQEQFFGSLEEVSRWLEARDA